MEPDTGAPPERRLPSAASKVTSPACVLATSEFRAVPRRHEVAPPSKPRRWSSDTVAPSHSRSSIPATVGEHTTIGPLNDGQASLAHHGHRMASR